MVRGKQHHKNESTEDASYNEVTGEPESTYKTIDVWVKDVKYSEKSQRYYTPMQISEEDLHTPNFYLPQNVEIFFRALMELFLSDSIMRTLRRHMNVYGR